MRSAALQPYNTHFRLCSFPLRTHFCHLPTKIFRKFDILLTFYHFPLLINHFFPILSPFSLFLAHFSRSVPPHSYTPHFDTSVAFPYTPFLYFSIQILSKLHVSVTFCYFSPTNVITFPLSLPNFSRLLLSLRVPRPSRRFLLFPDYTPSPYIPRFLPHPPDTPSLFSPPLLHAPRHNIVYRRLLRITSSTPFCSHTPPLSPTHPYYIIPCHFDFPNHLYIPTQTQAHKATIS